MENILITIGIVAGAWGFFNIGRLWESLQESRRYLDEIEKDIKKGKQA